VRVGLRVENWDSKLTKGGEEGGEGMEQKREKNGKLETTDEGPFH